MPKAPTSAPLQLVSEATRAPHSATAKSYGVPDAKGVADWGGIPDGVNAYGTEWASPTRGAFRDVLCL
jgi:hypothetical protein